jgi:site-specific DNA recombinase
MKRAAIYARYSTDLQNERSVEDQFELCRSYAAREKLSVVATFADRARSGASTIEREGLLDLVSQISKNKFDVVLVEAADRLSRDMADLAGIHKRLTFHGVEIRAVHSGVVDTAMVGLFGLVGQMQREEGVKKIRRGLAGVVKAGRSAGGLPYGYRVVNRLDERGEIIRGLREVDEAQAEVVRRVFREYAAGRSPRDIAAGLNRDRIAPPRGRLWNASTLNGFRKRGSGLLQNEIYAGLIAWNKTHKVRNPDTGRRVPRPNGIEDRHVSEVPHLRIVDADLWAAVQARRAERSSSRPESHRRPVHLLSGLLRCGKCGSGMSVKDRDHNGKIRVRCSAVAENGSCDNRRAIYLPHIEALVVSGMAEQLRDPRRLKFTWPATTKPAASWRKRPAATGAGSRGN